MFDIGLQEMILVGLVALVVLGPQRIPSAARDLGRIFFKFKKAIRELKFLVQQTWEEENPDE